MKKIPSLFRKKYTAKKLEKKIYKRLYVPEDKKYVKGLFVEVEKKGAKEIPIFAIPPEKAEQLAKKDMKRLKLLAKQIKSQKGRVNFVPLIVTIAFIAAIPICFSMFKNVLIKKAITTVCEKIFEAKCDIEKVDFKFFVNSGTERKTSGELPPKKAKKIKKEKKKTEKEASESKLGKVLAEKKAVAANSLEQNITGLFNQFNPETLMQTYYSQLQTPAISQQVQEQVPQIIAKWQAKPAEIQQTVDELQKAVNDIVSFDFNSVQSNPLKIKEFIETIDSTKKNIEKVKSDANGVLNSFNSDIAEADGLRKSVQGAVTHDMNFANSEINKIKSLNISDGTKLISGMFENVACDVLGKYYPYAVKGVDYLLELKSKQATKPKKEKVKKEKTKYSIKRAPGRDIFYRQDKVPALWIKKMAGSGPNFSAQATDIASNQDLINKPAKIDFNMDLWGLTHTAKLVVDFRTDTSEPLIRADYGLKNIPLIIPAEKFGAYPGVPSFDAKCAVDAILKIFDDEGFELTGKGLLTDLKISTVPFEPEYASKIYSNVMSRINTVRASVTSGFTATGGLKMLLDTDADVQVINSLKKEMEAQLSDIKNKLKDELTKRINEASGGALGQFGSLDEIKNKLMGSVTTANGFEKQINQKRTEAEKQLTGQATEKVNEAKKQATDNAKKELGNQLKKLF